MYALDTNTLIYAFKQLGRVGERLLQAQLEEVAIPLLVLYELEVGIARSNQPEKRRAQVDEMAALLRVLPFGREEMRTAARLRAALESRGTPLGPIDTLIAGTALHHEAILVTRNTREFGRVPGLRVVDWY